MHALLSSTFNVCMHVNQFQYRAHCSSCWCFRLKQESKMSEMDSSVCSVPGCVEGGRGRCSVCRTWYCSLECQTRDWASHKQTCPLPPPLLEWTEPPAVTQKHTQPLPAIVCSEMAIKRPEEEKLYEIIPLEYFESLAKFSIRLRGQVRYCQHQIVISHLNLFRRFSARSCRS